VARTLRLDYYGLKRRTAEAAAARREDVSPSFVEVCVADAGKVNGKLREHFHLVAGASTGGILTAAVGLGIPAADVGHLYKSRGREILPVPMSRLRDRLGRTFTQGVSATKYTDNGLQNVLKSISV
jgi:patatin-like phospholipase/acyl hydrolase